jgi:hypothetical protein
VSTVTEFRNVVADVYATAANTVIVRAFTAQAPAGGRDHGLISLRVESADDLARVAKALHLGLVKDGKVARQFPGYTITASAKAVTS